MYFRAETYSQYFTLVTFQCHFVKNSQLWLEVNDLEAETDKAISHRSPSNIHLLYPVETLC